MENSKYITALSLFLCWALFNYFLLNEIGTKNFRNVFYYISIYGFIAHRLFADAKNVKATFEKITYMIIFSVVIYRVILNIAAFSCYPLEQNYKYLIAFKNNYTFDTVELSVVIVLITINIIYWLLSSVRGKSIYQYFLR